MNWIKDILKPIRKRKLIYFLLFLQLAISIYSGYNALEALRNSKQSSGKLEAFKRPEYIYSIEVSLPEEISVKVFLGKLNILKDIKDRSKYPIIDYKYLEAKGITDTFFIAIGENIFDIFNIKLSEGNISFHSNKKQALAGYDFKEKYKLGDKVKHATVEGEYEIVGFLEKDQPDFDEATFGDFNNNILLIDDNIPKREDIFYIVSKDSYLDTRDYMGKLLEPYGTTIIKNLEETLIDNNYNVRKQSKNMAWYSMGMFIFSISVFISLMVLIINKSKRDIGIKVACGAKKISIYLTMVGQILFVYILSFIVLNASLFLKYSRRSLGWRYRLESIGINNILMLNLVVILLIIILSIPMLIKILRLKPAELIRNE